MNYNVFSADPPSMDTAVELDNLYPAIVQCFAVILCGYTAGRLGIISQSEVKGLNTFVGTFALPSVIFTSLVRVELTSVNWNFILGIFLAKAAVFFTVLGITCLLPGSLSTARAGLYAIFTTQTNDYALGKPIMEALYGKIHQDFLPYLYLVAPVNLTILNPFGFVFLELHKSRTRTAGAIESNSLIALNVLRNIVTNPVVFMSMLGVACNFIVDHNTPHVLFKILDIFSDAFSGTALFLLGLRMVGKVQTLHGTALIIPSVLIIVKLVVVPLVFRQVVHCLLSAYPDHSPPNSTATVQDYSTLAFLYGTVPSAPGVFVYATSYNLDVELIASAMVACTFLSAPIMFVSARLISLATIQPKDYEAILMKFNTDICVVSLFACVWLVTSFLCQKNSRSRHILNRLVNLLVISRICAILGYLSFQYLDARSGFLQRLFDVFGKFSTLVVIPCLAFAVQLIVANKFTLLMYLRPYFYAIYMGVPIFYHLASSYFNPEPMSKDSGNPILNLALFLALFMTVVCLVLTQRHSSTLTLNPMVMSTSERAALADHMVHEVSTSATRSVDMIPDPSEENKEDKEESVLQHVVLLILLCISLFISLSCGLWYAENNGTVGNILIEMDFVENAMRLGMPLIIFCVFAMDMKNIFNPIVNSLIQLCNTEEKVQLVPWDQLSFETRHVCDQFIGYHLRKCKSDIATNIRWKLLLYKQSFTGDQFVYWLLENDVVQDRPRAVEYAQHLIQGRVLRHIQGAYAFQDSRHKLYTFVPSANDSRR